VIYKPYEHQQTTLDFYKANHATFDASEMGCGKSMCIIKDLERLLKLNSKTKTLILAPKSLLHAVWEADFIKFAPHIKTSVATAPTKKREAAFNADANVYITNIDALVWLAKKPNSFWKDYTTIIIDEAEVIKKYERAG